MGEIGTRFNEVYRDYVTDGVPSSGINAPRKADIRALGSIIEEVVEGAAAGLIQAATWTALLAINGTRAGQPGRVVDDAGTHLQATATGYDGASVVNEGEYSWNATWSRWVRVGDNLIDGVEDAVDAAVAPAVASAVPAAVEAAVAPLKDSLTGIVQVIGSLEDPLTNGTSGAGAGTYGFGTAFTKDGLGIVFDYYGRGTGTVYVQIFSRSGNDNTIIAERAVAVTAGVHQEILDDLPFEAGQHVGLRTTAGLIAVVAGDGNNGGYWSTASAISTGGTYTDSSLASLNFKARFSMLKQVVNATDFQSVETDSGEMKTALGLDTFDTFVLGRPVDSPPVTGSPIGSSTYVYSDPATRDIVLDEIDVYVLSEGTMYLKTMDKTGNDFAIDGLSCPVELGSTGLVTATPSRRFVLKEGQRLGINRGSASFAVTGSTVGDSGGYYNGSGDAFTDSSVITNIRLEFGARFSANGISQRVLALEEETGIGLQPDTEAFHLKWMLGESHIAGRAVGFVSNIPEGRGYCFRRATASLAHLQDPTGNDTTATGGSGRGSFGPSIGQAMLDMTNGAVGAVIINSGEGGATVAQWGSAGAYWLQAVADKDAALTAIRAAQIPIAGASIDIMLGTNNMYAGTPTATFKTDMVDLFARARTELGAGDEVPICLYMIPPYVDSSYDAAVLLYQRAIGELVRENPNVYLASSAPKFALEKGWLNSDLIHLNQMGNDAVGPGSAAVGIAHGTGLYPADLEI